jgi:hypothetical protein
MQVLLTHTKCFGVANGNRLFSAASMFAFALAIILLTFTFK